MEPMEQPLKNLEKRLDELQIYSETIQTTVLLKSAQILKRVLECGEGLLSLRLKWKSIN